MYSRGAALPNESELSTLPMPEGEVFEEEEEEEEEEEKEEKETLSSEEENIKTLFPHNYIRINSSIDALKKNIEILVGSKEKSKKILRDLIITLPTEMVRTLQIRRLKDILSSVPMEVRISRNHQYEMQRLIDSIRSEVLTFSSSEEKKLTQVKENIATLRKAITTNDFLTFVFSHSSALEEKKQSDPEDLHIKLVEKYSFRRTIAVLFPCHYKPICESLDEIEKSVDGVPAQRIAFSWLQHALLYNQPSDESLLTKGYWISIHSTLLERSPLMKFKDSLNKLSSNVKAGFTKGTLRKYPYSSDLRRGYLLPNTDLRDLISRVVQLFPGCHKEIFDSLLEIEVEIIKTKAKDDNTTYTYLWVLRLQISNKGGEERLLNDTIYLKAIAGTFYNLITALSKSDTQYIADKLSSLLTRIQASYPPPAPEVKENISMPRSSDVPPNPTACCSVLLRILSGISLISGGIFILCLMNTPAALGFGVVALLGGLGLFASGSIDAGKMIKESSASLCCIARR